jgi:hypothetical protein
VVGRSFIEESRRAGGGGDAGPLVDFAKILRRDVQKQRRSKLPGGGNDVELERSDDGVEAGQGQMQGEG